MRLPGGSFLTAQTLLLQKGSGQVKSFVRGKLIFGPILQPLSMPQYPDLHERLKAFLRPILESRGKRAKLAKMMGAASQSYINQWIDLGLYNPGIDKLPAIADFLGFSSVEELFAALNPNNKTRQQATKDVTYPDLKAGVGLRVPEEGVPANVVVPVQADPLQSRATLQRTHDDVDAAIDILIATRLRLAGLLGRADDSEQSHRTQSPQARVGGASERRSGADASGRQKAAPSRRTGVR